jgi:hypothetical protein
MNVRFRRSHRYFWKGAQSNSRSLLRIDVATVQSKASTISGRCNRQTRMILAPSFLCPSTSRQCSLLCCAALVLTIIPLLIGGSCQLQKAANFPPLTRRSLGDLPLTSFRPSSVSPVPRNVTRDSNVDLDFYSNDSAASNSQRIEVDASTSSDQYLQAVQSSSSSAGAERLAVIAVGLAAAVVMIVIFAWVFRKYPWTSMTTTQSGQTGSEDIGLDTRRPQHRSVEAGVSILKNGGVLEVSERLYVS